MAQNEDQVKTITYEGVKIPIRQGIEDDIEIVDMIDEIQNENNVVRVIGLCKRILGKDKFNEIIAAYKTNHNTDRMPTSEMETLISQLFEALTPKD